MLFVIWIALCIAIGFAAQLKNRSTAAWFFISIILSPIIAGIILVCMSTIGTGTEKATQPRPRIVRRKSFSF